MISIRSVVAVALAILVAGCAVRLGGPDPEEYRTLALRTSADLPPDRVAGLIRGAGADVVLLSAEADSAWMADVAEQTDLVLSGPGPAGPVSLAFLAGEPVGDTTVALPIEGRGAQLVVHDALYEIDERRRLDLLVTRIDRSVDARAAVRALMGYVATDVLAEAAVVLAIDAGGPDRAERIGELVRPALMDARDCAAGPEEDEPASVRSDMLLFYGPELRIRCESAEVRQAPGRPLLARLVVRR